MGLALEGLDDCGDANVGKQLKIEGLTRKSLEVIKDRYWIEMSCRWPSKVPAVGRLGPCIGVDSS